MGYLRLWLALSVMLYHFGAPPALRVLNGGTCVRCFFVLSGYVISLVLDGRYRGRLGLYLKLRLLRILPSYYVALALTFAAWSLVCFAWHLDRGPVAFWVQHPAGPLASVAMGFQQLVLVGMEFFSRLNLGGQPVSSYMIIPQAWSLSVELCFYLAAPWLLRLPSRWLALSVLFSLALHAIPDDGSARLAPTLPWELGYFSLGALAWRWKRGRDLEARALVLPLLGLGLLFAALPYGLTQPRWQDISAPLLVALALPGLQGLGERWPLDRQASEVSYALYLIHPVSGLATAMLIKGIPIWPRTAILTLTGLAAAAALWALVERPVSALRRRLHS